MNKKYKYSVLIGRFQPFHNAHLALVKEAAKHADNVIIVIGSANSLATFKNPWSFQQREEMIVRAVQEHGIPLNHNNNLFFCGVEDTIYSDGEWVTNVQSSVNNIAKNCGVNDICIMAHNKDETSYYLNYFNMWKPIEISTVNTSEGGPALSATKIRELYFEGYDELLKAVCPDSVINYIKAFKATEKFAELKKEYDDALKYDLQYENVPYGQVNFVTVDTMVVQSGHVLLVQRKHSPGAGSWALPGGHLNVNETFVQGALRELKEETNIKVPDKVLMGSIVYDNIFDHPERSLRGRIKKKFGRTITRLFVIKLDDSEKLPPVKASDDAQKAWWFTFGEVKNMRNILFEDHYDMIMHGLSRL